MAYKDNGVGERTHIETLSLTGSVTSKTLETLMAGHKAVVIQAHADNSEEVEFEFDDDPDGSQGTLRPGATTPVMPSSLHTTIRLKADTSAAVAVLYVLGT